MAVSFSDDDHAQRYTKQQVSPCLEFQFESQCQLPGVVMKSFQAEDRVLHLRQLKNRLVFRNLVFVFRPVNLPRLLETALSQNYQLKEENSCGHLRNLDANLEVWCTRASSDALTVLVKSLRRTRLTFLLLRPRIQSDSFPDIMIVPRPLVLADLKPSLITRKTKTKTSSSPSSSSSSSSSGSSSSSEVGVGDSASFVFGRDFTVLRYPLALSGCWATWFNHLLSALNEDLRSCPVEDVTISPSWWGSLALLHTSLDELSATSLRYRLHLSCRHFQLKVWRTKFQWRLNLHSCTAALLKAAKAVILSLLRDTCPIPPSLSAVLNKIETRLIDDKINPSMSSGNDSRTNGEEDEEVSVELIEEPFLPRHPNWTSILDNLTAFMCILSSSEITVMFSVRLFINAK